MWRGNRIISLVQDEQMDLTGKQNGGIQHTLVHAKARCVCWCTMYSGHVGFSILCSRVEQCGADRMSKCPQVHTVCECVHNVATLQGEEEAAY